MRKLILTVGIATVAFALPVANAEEERDYTLGGSAFAGAPYEETLFDRSWPYVKERMPEEGGSAGATAVRGSPWDGDFNFIAPPQ